MSYDSGMSPADLAAVTGNNDGFGGNGAWWIIILFLFAFCGWGNGGYGGNGSGAADNYVLASDFATLQRQMSDGFGALERKGDSINNGLCDGFYAMNTGLLNGFSGVQQSLNTQGFETRNAITQAQIAQMQNANAIQGQIAQCCCDVREGIAGVNYNMAMNTNAINNTVQNGFCQTGFNMQQATRDITDNANANTKAILDFLVQDKMSTLQRENDALRLAASQADQNATLIGALKAPCPVPSYIVPNPNAVYTCGCNCGA